MSNPVRFLIGLLIASGVVVLIRLVDPSPKYEVEVVGDPVKEISVSRIFEPVQGSLKSIADRKCSQGYLVSFWATWCPPCLEEIPSLEFMHRVHKDVCLVSIAVDDDKSAVVKFLGSSKTEISFPILWDKGGAYTQTLGISKFPETYYVDRSGQILYRWLGPQDWLSSEVVQKLDSYAKIK